jgi:hypothetical protein
MMSRPTAPAPPGLDRRTAGSHYPDDDNVYFIGNEQGLGWIQLDIAPGGQPLFTIENGRPHQTSVVSEAVTVIRSWLEHSRPSAGPG